MLGDSDATVGTALRAAIAQLVAAEVPSAAHDARTLMAAAITDEARRKQPGTRQSISALDLILHTDDPVPASFSEMILRRQRREPLQLILGSAPVVGVDLAVCPGVFIPRPETDLLIDWAATSLIAWNQQRCSSPLRKSLTPAAITVVDLCSGPGTVSLGLAHLLTVADFPTDVELRIIGVEIDPVAVELAQANLNEWRDQGHIDRRISIEFHQGDAADPTTVIALGLVAGADMVVSNPPYVPEGPAGEYVTAVDPEVRLDPHRAVFSGVDGLELMRPLAEVIALACAPHAWVGVEHDDTTGVKVRALLQDAGIKNTAQHTDFTGRDRYVTGIVVRDPGFRPPPPVGQRLQ